LRISKTSCSEPEALGTFTFGPLHAHEKNYPIEVEMGYDGNGRVAVVARDPRTGRSLEREFGGQEEQDLSREFKQLQNLVVLD
jgi:hypothetical protein